MTTIRNLVTSLREHGPWPLVFAMLIGGGLWGFVELADEVQDGETHEFDRALLLALRGGPAWLDMAARDITSLGGSVVLVLLTLGVTGFLLLSRKPGTACFLLLSVAGGSALSWALKAVFDRPRPDLVPHAVEVVSASFPSGHSMLAMTTYLTLGAVLSEVQSRQRVRLYILAWALCLALLVGLSRVYLGVHWPTDVLAGWCLGSAWALLCASVAWWMRRRGMISSV